MLRATQIAAKSSATDGAAVSDVPGVPAVVIRTSFNATAVAVVLNTPISWILGRTVVPPTNAKTGSVVDPAVDKAPAEYRAISFPFHHQTGGAITMSGMTAAAEAPRISTATNPHVCPVGDDMETVFDPAAPESVQCTVASE